MLEVFCRGANQRDAADVDLLDRLLERRAPVGHGGFERIQVDDDDPDARDAVFDPLTLVYRIVAIRQDPAEDARMQGLHAPVEERGKTGEFGDLLRRDAVLDQVLVRSACRVDRRPAGFERARQPDDAGAVVDRDQRRFALGRRFATRQAPSPAQAS